LSTSREIFSGTVFQFQSGFHFENYVDAWNAQNVSVYFANSLLYASVSCVGVLLIAGPASYVLSRFEFFANKAIKSSLIVAMGIPAIMIIMPIYSMTVRWGIKGRALLIFLYICMHVPNTTIYLLNFFATLSRTYEEAAAIDGCSPARTFWVIMLPLIQPALITITIFNFLGVWNEFFMALIFASSERMMSVGVGLLQIVNAMKYTGNYGGLFAAVVIVFMPTFILYLFLSEKIIAGVTGGGIKG
ncbi:MAG: carbohydrate ABC transporter permease, partial [Lachnospiraceae bacterium]|nr:carbohydrate ABC transporter permease [Lachnospiraceae bacterium]